MAASNPKWKHALVFLSEKHFKKETKSVSDLICLDLCRDPHEPPDKTKLER